ncbi:MAG: magnesium-translocating P-type ATPase [Clostridia bacterium]|nr:magnesium-translocating P-type ATPase [Clostridia bacterium]
MKKTKDKQTRSVKEMAAVRDRQNAWLRKMAHEDTDAVFSELGTRMSGLSEEEIHESREKHGSNKVTDHKKKSLGQRLLGAFINPFSVILMVLLLVSVITDVIFPLFTDDDMDFMTIIIIAVMVIVSGVLRFVQETRSGNAAEKLMALITTQCTVDRQGYIKEDIPLEDVVVGDIVHLSSGDMVPADLRIIQATDLFVSQSSMTGESEPVEKIPAAAGADVDTITDYSGIAFMGTNVISGSAKGVVVATGDRTLFGTMSAGVSDEAVETSFSKGVNAVSWVLIRFMLVMVPIVFLLNGLTNGLIYGGGAEAWLSAFMYGMSIAVGLTPEMLPMIVTTCLAQGAVSMSKEKVVVKNLNSIQNFGAMDILCTDKTGTLTQDKVVLEYHIDVMGRENSRVLRHAYLNSYFQTGYRNLMDQAIITKTEEEEERDKSLTDLSETYTKIDEIPFDFVRRRLTTVVQNKDGKIQMVTKGAVEEMLSICKYAEVDGEVKPLSDEIKGRILKTVDTMNSKGFRVLAIAQKSDFGYTAKFSVEDEKEMVLMGYLAFLDPPKETTRGAIRALREHGVMTKVLTGDNEKVTATICAQVGLNVRGMLLGRDIELMTDEELEERVEDTDVFAKLTPDQKTRVVSALRARGHVVGFMGDGINDAAAMKAADVGISVDTAVDIAKESADIILLEKDLMVLEKGIIQGRKTYANMIKYIKMTASSNFGNMFSVIAASALLPGFQPMLAQHLIFLNLIYDLSCITIPWDNVDPEFIQKPRTWDASSVGSFMIWIGPSSCFFDFTTYAFMYFVFCPMANGGYLYSEITPELAASLGTTSEAMKASYEGMFQAGWFIESMWTQTLVIHMIRTEKVPFIQSHASWQVTTLTLIAIAVLTIIPFTPFGTVVLGFTSPQPIFFAYLIPCVILYMALATCMKRAYVKHYGELL